MVVDFHAHLFPERIAEKALRTLRDRCHTATFVNGTYEQLRDSARAAGIDVTVGLPVATEARQVVHINDFAAAVCERAFVRELDGGCSSPIAAHAVWAEGTLTLRGLYCDEKTMVWDTCRAERSCTDRQTAAEIGIDSARELKARVESMK